MDENTYIIVGSRPWNRTLFNDIYNTMPGDWHYINRKDILNQKVPELQPKFIFFVHWSEYVVDWMVEQYKCICFHPTDLPYGRGGSPIQNLILAGHVNTTLTAFRMTSRLDAGPIYFKKHGIPLKGTLYDIFDRLMDITYVMIANFIEYEVEAIPQTGNGCSFVRRKPEQSDITGIVDHTKLYDHIRMLDADTYPRAFIKVGDLKLEFSNAQLEDGNLTFNTKVVSA